MRQTKQRAAILRALQSTDCHPTADWVYTEVKKDLPRISLGTVYRLLGALAAEGKVSVLALGDSAKRYDGQPGPHHHVVCTACGQVNDAPDLVSADARTEIERWTGYAISYLRLDWYGLCSVCRASQKETNAQVSL
jgi:Fe2+ or Zn2+ uptake regulation protein